MKSLTNFLTFLIYLAIAAHGSPLQQEVEARADACTTKSMIATIATINSGVGKPLAFCNWYLTDGRTRSPINGLSVQSLQSACVCLGGAKPARKAVASTTMNPGAITTSCAAANVQLLKARFVDYKTFCTFYVAAPRDSSPLPALGPKGLWNACKCALGLASTSTSSSSASGPTSHSTSKVTSSTSSHTTLTTTTSKPTSNAISSTSPFSTTTSKSTSSSPSSSSSTTTKIIPSTSSRTTSAISTTSTLPVLSTITSIIEAQTYQSFCSAFLSYTVPSETVTTTEAVHTTMTLSFGPIATESTTLVVDTTVTSVETDVSTSITSVTENVNTITATETVTLGPASAVTTSDISTFEVGKRQAFEGKVPSSLSSYNSVLLSSACQIVVPKPTSTATTLVTALTTTTATTLVRSQLLAIGSTTVTSTITETMTVETLGATTVVVSATTTLTTTITTATGVTGQMMQPGQYWGFSDSPGVGSALQMSTADIFSDDFTFTGNQDGDQDGSGLGYIVHTATGLCLTMPGATAGSHDYNGALLLQICGTTETPPYDQSFAANRGCIAAGADYAYYFDTTQITSTATAANINADGDDCIEIDEGESESQ